MSWRALMPLVLVAPAMAQVPVGSFTSGDELPGDAFGHSIAIEGDLLVCGAPLPFGSGLEPGRAHVFVRTPGGFVETARIEAPQGFAGDVFGYSLDVSAGRILVGAYGAGSSAGHGQEWGAAYVFESSGGTWSHRATLVAPQPGAYDWYGIDVALDGTQALICAVGDDSARGAAYLVEDTGTRWRTTTVLRASDGDAGHFFGSDGDLSGGVAVVGAPAAFGGAGAAYVFEGAPGQPWIETAILSPPMGGQSALGYRVAIWEGWIFVAAHHDSHLGPAAGRVFVYREGDSGWELRQELTGADTQAEHLFGKTLVVDHGRVLVGSEDHGHLGAAYLFELEGGTWREVEKFTSPENLSGTRFGRGLACGTDELFVGAFGGDGTPGAPGRVHFYDAGGRPTSSNFCTPSSGAQLSKYGSTRIRRGDLGLLVQGALPGAVGVFFYGNEVQARPFGRGLCVGGGDIGLQRLSGAVADSGGTIRLDLDLQSAPLGSGPGHVEAGSTWLFQGAYRGGGSSSIQSSDALRILFTP